MQKTKDKTDKNIYLYTYTAWPFFVAHVVGPEGKNQDATISLLVCSFRQKKTRARRVFY